MKILLILAAMLSAYNVDAAVSNIIVNPGFELGTHAWTTSGSIITSNSAQPAKTGQWKAWFLGYGAERTETMYQQVTIPANATVATLTFWLHIDTEEQPNEPYDTLTIQALTVDGTLIKNHVTYSNLSANTGYIQKTFNLIEYKGQTIRLNFLGEEDSSVKTSFVLDDFLLNVTTPDGTSSCAPAPTSSLVVNVKDKGATGNGVTNDTAAIQAAINDVAGTGGTVIVPDGIYMINVVTKLKLKSNMTFKMSSGAVLKAIPTSSALYAILDIYNQSNVNVIGGTLQGERTQHIGTTGESGFGVMVYSSNNVVVEGVTAKDNWGDGFVVGTWNGEVQPKNVKFCSVISDNNRRLGLTLASVDGAVVKNSTFKNSNGTPPMMGMDLEPIPSHGQSVNNVQITGSKFLYNRAGGLKAHGSWSSTSITNVTIEGNTFADNGGGTSWAPGMTINANASGLKVIGNTFSKNRNEGIELESGASNNIISGNTITDNTTGVLIYDISAKNNTVSNNIFARNRYAAITNNGIGTIISNNIYQ